MSTGLLSQLDAYYSQIDEAQNPIRPDEVAALVDSPVRELLIPVPADPRRGWLVAVAAAVAVLVLVGGAALLFRVIGPVATTPPTVPLSSLAWSQVPYDEATFGGAGDRWMTDVTAGGPGLVAVGQEGTGALADADAAVWTSPDGITWSRVPHDEAVLGGEGEQVMWSVTAGGPGLVAVGYDGLDAAVWTSPDGITWSRVPHDEAVFFGGGMDGVTVGGPGLVAVGVAGTGRTADGRVLTFTKVDDETFTDEETGTLWNIFGLGIEGPLEGTQLEVDDHAVVWTSPDGITWSRVPHDEAVLGGEDAQSMESVTAGGPGLVAVGRDGPSDDSDAAVWTSPDGITWSRVPHDEAVLGGEGDQVMERVTAGGPGLVAVGWDGVYLEDTDAAVWTSPDGITWSRVPHDEAVFGGEGDQAMVGVTAAGPGLVAVGYDGLDAAGDSDVAVWTSPDGITWSRVPHDEAVLGGEGDREMVGVTAGGPGLVAVGYDNVHDAAVWVAARED